jgi:hypothetical protein
LSCSNFPKYSLNSGANGASLPSKKIEKLLSISTKNTQREKANKKQAIFLQVHVESISKDLMNEKISFCIEF